MAPSSQLEIDQLLHQVCKEHHHRARQSFHAVGLHRGQPRILELLWERDGRTQRELGEHMHSNAATITKMLQRMEANGFVARRPDSADQRISRVYLTPKARAVQAEVNQIYDDIATTVLAGFTAEETMLLRRLLVQMRDNLRVANRQK